jgi:hypothetical protein
VDRGIKGVKGKGKFFREEVKRTTNNENMGQERKANN